MDFSRNHKALSSILIIVIVSAVLVVALGATAAYLWFWPGNLKTEEMVFSDFTAVEVSWAFEVKVTQSSSYSVVISADEKIFNNIEVTQNGFTLVIGLEPGTIDSSGLFRKVEITMPNLNKLILSGAARGTVEGFGSSTRLILGLSGASSLEMTDINVGDVEIGVSGASTLIARGTADNLFASVYGKSNVYLSNFLVTNADVSVNGASGVTINLEGILNYAVTGASTLEYIGNPSMGSTYASSLSTVKQK